MQLLGWLPGFCYGTMVFSCSLQLNKCVSFGKHTLEKLSNGTAQEKTIEYPINILRTLRTAVFWETHPWLVVRVLLWYSMVLILYFVVARLSWVVVRVLLWYSVVSSCVMQVVLSGCQTVAMK